ncbi:MAG: pyridoxamine kinase [Clostridia bacterium]|nr:pyridoxamine kinase [Clostridia bacterium]
MKNKVLLINDLPGYGKVALSAMFPVLSSMGCDIYNLPTALVSNTLDYGKFEILDTTEYMRKTLKVWDELEFEFDCICTGFIVSEEQVKLIKDYVDKQKKRGVFVVVDPIMGDDGKLYNGITEETVVNMRELCKIANIITPNFTEACYLADMYRDRKTVGSDEMYTLIEKLSGSGQCSVVITSVACDDGQNYICGYSHEDDDYFVYPFEMIPVRFPGTGDLFSAYLVGAVIRRWPLKAAVQQAMGRISELILKNKGNEDKYKGIPIEQYLAEGSIKDGETEDKNNIG